MGLVSVDTQSLAICKLNELNAKAGMRVKKGLYHIVFRIPVPVSDASLLGQLVQYAQQQGWYGKKTPDFLLMLAKHPVAIQQQADQLCRAQGFNMAGADLGKTNLVAIGHHTKRLTKGMVVSGKRFAGRYNRLDARLDGIKAARTPAAVKAIQQRKEQGEKLMKEERRLIQLSYRDLYADDTYLAALARRTAYVQDTVHKLAGAIVADLQAKRVQLLVVGKNDGW